MSNFLAVATVTATLSKLLSDAVDLDIPGARVTADRPHGSDNGAGAPTVTIFLYQVTPNAGWRNLNIPLRNQGGALRDQPRAALDLHYLLSFSGDETRLEPQRLLGSVVAALEANPVLSRRQVGDAVTGTSYLAGSDLADQVELVKFTPLPISLEDLSKLWSVFFQVKYTLSVAYLATVVLVESKDTPQAALPVRQRVVYVVPVQQPVIDRVQALAGPDQPILIGDGIAIEGRRLNADTVLVRIADWKGAPSEVTGTQVKLPFSSVPAGTLRAGIQAVQVVHPLIHETPPPPVGVESNIVPFVLHPTLTGPTPQNMVDIGGNRYSGEIAVGVNPPVGPRQRVSLLLDRVPSQGSESYSFPAPARAADATSVTFAVANVAAGSYLVRIQVDGAESLLGQAPDGTFASPTVVIP